MELISAEHVENTWRKVASLTPVVMNKEILAFGKSQPDLLAFTVSYMKILQLRLKS
jgi:hypothetical protein